MNLGREATGWGATVSPYAAPSAWRERRDGVILICYTFTCHMCSTKVSQCVEYGSLNSSLTIQRSTIAQMNVLKIIQMMPLSKFAPAD